MLVSRFIHPPVVTVMLVNNITQPVRGADYAGEQHNQPICRGRFIAPTADLSAPRGCFELNSSPSFKDYLSVGARVVGSGRVGLYGRPPFPDSM